MRTSDADILIVPGWSDSGPDHWQSRWERNLKTARRVEQDDWLRPERTAWTSRLAEAVAAATRPVILVGHSLGVITVAHAASLVPADKVVGAFLVGPADVENADAWPVTQGVVWSDTHAGFAPIPREPLPFPSCLVASSDDPYCSAARARELSHLWRSTLVEAGNLGHINTASGHGPWPEGLLRFGVFLRQL